MSCGDDGAATQPGPREGEAGATSSAGKSGSSGGTGTAGASGKAGDSGARAGTSGSGRSGGAGRSGGGTAGQSANGRSGMSDEDAGVSSMPGGGMDEDDAGVECLPPPHPLNLGGFPKCSMDICPAQDSVCMPMQWLVDLKITPESIALLASCDEMTKCVPIALASQAGHALLTKCESVIGAEGRCLSTCVPQVALQASQLPKANCGETELCAPCYDPRTGEATGACSQGCDKGPTEPPKRFPECCGDRGLCVPPALAGDQAPNLVIDTCSPGNLCAPRELTDPTFKPRTCDSLDGAEGRCISTCVGGAVAKQRDRLPTAGCEEDEVCAPCYDPITGESTGSCNVNGDKPTRPAYTFPRCCGEGADSAGVCVEPALAGSQASILRAESCGDDRLCAPILKAQDPKAKFQTCRSALGEGACINSCIVDPLQALILSRDGCKEGELCAPCNLLGSSTMACD